MCAGCFFFDSFAFRVRRRVNYTGFRDRVSFVRVPSSKHSPQRTRRTRRKTRTEEKHVGVKSRPGADITAPIPGFDFRMFFCVFPSSASSAVSAYRAFQPHPLATSTHRKVSRTFSLLPERPDRGRANQRTKTFVRISSRELFTTSPCNAHATGCTRSPSLHLYRLNGSGNAPESKPREYPLELSGDGGDHEQFHYIRHLRDRRVVGPVACDRPNGINFAPGGGYRRSAMFEQLPGGFSGVGQSQVCASARSTPLVLSDLFCHSSL